MREMRAGNVVLASVTSQTGNVRWYCMECEQSKFDPETTQPIYAAESRTRRSDSSRAGCASGEILGICA